MIEKLSQAQIQSLAKIEASRQAEIELEKKLEEQRVAKMTVARIKTTKLMVAAQAAGVNVSDIALHGVHMDRRLVYERFAALTAHEAAGA